MSARPVHSPWPEAERLDANEVLDWVAKQPFCDGRATLCGQSYDGVAALWTLAGGHPLVKSAVVISPFWDIYRRALRPLFSSSQFLRLRERSLRRRGAHVLRCASPSLSCQSLRTQPDSQTP